jgi:hypothetical protein
VYEKEQRMKANQDLIGKTITGVIAVTPPGDDVGAKRGLRRFAGRKKASFPPRPDTQQLALNVA